MDMTNVLWAHRYTQGGLPVWQAVPVAPYLLLIENASNPGSWIPCLHGGAQVQHDDYTRLSVAATKNLQQIMQAPPVLLLAPSPRWSHRWAIPILERFPHQIVDDYLGKKAKKSVVQPGSWWPDAV